MRKTKNKNKWIRWIAIAVILITAVWLGRRMFTGGGSRYDEAAAKTADITTYYAFSGNIAAENRQFVLADMVMQIKDIKVRDGDSVKAGDILFSTSTNVNITAPIDGEVSSLAVQQNQQVMGGTKLCEIIDYSMLLVNVKVDEYDLPSVSVGKEAAVHVNALDRDVSGTVSSIAKEGLATSGVSYFAAQIKLAPDEALRIGMSAEVRVHKASVKNAVTIPVSFVQFEPDNTPFVYLKDVKGKAVKTGIEIGINDGAVVEIRSGVASGDTVMSPKDTTFGFRRNSSGRINQTSSSGDNGDEQQ